MDDTISNLNNNEQRNLFEETNHIYSFGDSRKFSAIYPAKIPAIIRSYRFKTETEIVSSDIPPIFSKSSVKTANIKWNFEDVNIIIFNPNIPLYY